MRARRGLVAGCLALSLAACLDGGGDGWGPGYGVAAGYGAGGGRSGERWIEPSPGVRCDTWERVCYDRGGPELSLTRDRFGKSAAKDLEDRIGGNWRTDTRYNPKEGVKCDLEDELCEKRGEVDYKNTRQQFGRKPALEAQQPDGTIQARRKVTCDPASEVCVKNERPTVDQTRWVFGDRAARNLKKQLKE
jgi:hypothetical protein